MSEKKAWFAVIVAGLGYFVDVYDLIVFSVVRMSSLRDLGLTGDALTQNGVLLLNMQLGGMLLGGIAWGMLGDKKGRLSILFGSILLYSLANIANAFVTDVPQYAICRFLAGIGLAGEIGAGITLVSELLPKEKRGIGTMVVASLGVMGGFTASLVGDSFHWQTAYIVGGCMGLALLVLRFSVVESGLFKAIGQRSDLQRGSLTLLFSSKDRIKRFACCTLLGLPLWFVVGLILTFAPEIGRELGFKNELKTSGAILYFYGGLVVGDIGSGLLSQWLRSRRKALYICISATLVTTLTLLNLPGGENDAVFYWICGLLGTFGGYWAVFLTTTAESFGTNLRATVTTSVPNLVRGGAILLSSLFAAMKGTFGVVTSLEIIAVMTFTAGLVAVWALRETFAVDLNYLEK